MKDLTLNNCILAQNFSKSLSDKGQRFYFEFYLRKNPELREGMVINLNIEVKNQNEQLSTGHIIISLDTLGKILMDFIKQYENGHLN